MKPARRFKLVLITAPDLKSARALARGALEARLIACANLVPQIESHYRWRGRVQRSREVLMLVKTTRARLRELEGWIVEWHPYDTPEILVLDLAAGNGRYLEWLDRCCAKMGCSADANPG